MRQTTVFSMGNGRAVSFAARILEQNGVRVATALDRSVTHVLLDVPTKDADFSQIPAGVTVIGGNLDAMEDHVKVDLLKDDQYLSENAAITADCALRLLGDRLPVAFRGCPVLVIGWGRIGKCLARLLKAMGAEVTVAARKDSDRAMLKALGYKAVAFDQLSRVLHGFRVIYNTVPEKMLSESTTFNSDCVKIELASVPGLPGECIDGRGLPGRLAPESSGRLIAEMIGRRI